MGFPTIQNKMNIEFIPTDMRTLGLEITCNKLFVTSENVRERLLKLWEENCKKGIYNDDYGLAGVAIITDDEGMHIFQFYYSVSCDDGDIKHVGGSNLSSLMHEQYRYALKSLIPAYACQYANKLAAAKH